MRFDRDDREADDRACDRYYDFDEYLSVPVYGPKDRIVGEYDRWSEDDNEPWHLMRVGYGSLLSLLQDQPLPPGLLLQSCIVVFGDKSAEGRLIDSVALPWFEIMRRIERERDFLYYFARNPRKFEEFLAGAYERAGWPKVELTSRSNDRGRDIVATKPGFGSVRFLEQAKAYSPGRLVTHDDVRALLGVLASDQNASKGIITTTSDFQPKILESEQFRPFIPHRLELKNGDQLRTWLLDIRKKSHQGGCKRGS